MSSSSLDSRPPGVLATALDGVAVCVLPASVLAADNERCCSRGRCCPDVGGLATVVSSPTAAASVVAAKLVTYEGGGVTTRARLASEFAPVVPALRNYAFGASPRERVRLRSFCLFLLSLPLSLSLSLSLSPRSTSRSLRLRRIYGAYADNRAALCDESAIIDGEGGDAKRETG